MTPEGKIKRKLDNMLKRLGVWYFSPQGGAYGKSGIPDRILCVEGKFVAVECKRDAKHEPTKLQNKILHDIKLADGAVFVVYDDDTIADVERYLIGVLRASRSRSSGFSAKA